MMIKKVILGSLLSVAAILTASVSYAQVQSRFVADRVIAIIGDRMILESDLQMAEAYKKENEQIPFSERLSTKEIGELLHQLMSQKLLAAQAQLDSLPTDDARVYALVQERIDSELERHEGSVQKLEEARRKPMYMFRDELFLQMKEYYLSQIMTENIQSKINITPDEVKEIVRKTEKNELPLIPEQYEYSEIVLKAPTDAASKNLVKDRLLEMRERIMNGANFAALARLYSDDTESAKRGGEIEFAPASMFQTPFADAMMSLKIGQMSGIVETSSGFHLIELIDKQNGKYKCRHILLRNKFADDKLQIAMNKLDSIQNEIVDTKKISFEDAAIKFSENVDSKAMNGVAVNSRNAQNYGARTKSTRFFIDDLQGDYETLKNMKEGETSKAFATYDETGNLVCKIVRLNKRIGEHIADTKQDFTILTDFALRIKKDKEFTNWFDKQKMKMYVRVEAPYNTYAPIVENWSK